MSSQVIGGTAGTGAESDTETDTATGSGSGTGTDTSNNNSGAGNVGADDTASSAGTLSTKTNWLTQRSANGSRAVARHEAGAVELGGNTRGHSGGAVSWLDEYDPSTNKWRVLPSAPTKRDHMEIAISNGKLIVAGGRQTRHPGVTANMVSAVEIYNIATGKWSSGKAIPTKRAGTMAVSVGNEVIIIGGESTSSKQALNTVEAYNVRTNQWRRLKPLKQGRHSGGAVVMGGRVHVVSGNTRRGGGAETTSHETLAIHRPFNTVLCR